MSNRAVFEGLIIDEKDRQVEVAYVGGEPCYVVDDDGFRRHIPSEQVDRQVLLQMSEQVEGNESLLSEQAAKFLGMDDIFSKAILERQIRQIDQQIENLLVVGIPEEGRVYLGMLGLRIRINIHGDVIEIQQPGIVDPGSEE